MEKRKTIAKLGKFCNNDGMHFVRDLKVCPSTIRPTAPFRPWNEVSELEWARMKGV
jgi:hypothetical protein